MSESGRKTVKFTIDRSLLSKKESASITVQIVFDNGKKTSTKLLIIAENAITSDVDQGRYLYFERQGYCSMKAAHFAEKKDVNGKGFRVIRYLGREGDAIKAFPPMCTYPDANKAPYVRYSLLAENTGSYYLDFYVMARNPAQKGGRLKFAFSVNEEEPKEICSVSEQYYTEWFHKEWADGVLNHMRVLSTKVILKKGKNDIFVYAGEPGVILEKLLLYQDKEKMAESYLGAAESYYSG